jgi:hypothetical protein
MIYFTSICSNYLPKAMALAESVKRHDKHAWFALCLVEREAPAAALTFPHFDEVILAKDAGWDAFDSFMFRHTIVEASTAVKPRFMIHLTERHANENKFVYLDPDVLVYSKFTELDGLLNQHSIVLAPHLLRPGNIDMEISSLAHGAYNLGFLAVRRSENADRFLSWWAERLFLFCYDDISRGIFTDQKWINLAPCFYDCHILKHHGYNFATWSLLGSNLEEAAGCYFVNGDPLRFIHFSGLDSGTIDKAIGWWLTSANRETFVKLLAEYRALLDHHGQESLGKTPWSYATYADGNPIALAARVAYRDPELWARIPNPFGARDADFLPPGTAVKATSTLSLETLEPPTILTRFFRSTREIGLGATVVKVVRRIASGNAKTAR